ncbi:sulfite exporter TauE/SafE family protein [Stygiolobus caldivivus]|uniref:Probable membrane transporter protein n=1 Tax=Stygiolobus caldivivus TaxID=2824673 RepID=A0A8D5U813_9CREN|nr:sulfite exporter TauE/SafE family protein [Stygiolobus caldivivus]BCU70887.1 transporter [Stygiolobus caldivivus]
MSLALVVILILIGVAVGALTGITGSSGVLIVVPALSYLGLSFKDAVGSSLLVDVITTVSVVVAYIQNKNTDYKISSILALGAVVGSQIGVRIAVETPEKLLEGAFAVFTSVMAYISFRRSKNPELKLRHLNLGKLSFPAGFLMAILVGIVTGTLGASGGIMFIALMILLFSSMCIKKMIGTATLSMLFSATSGAIAYFSVGLLDLEDSLIIGTTALLFGYLFARMANKMRPSTIYLFLGSTFVLTTVSEIFKII